MMKSIVNQSDRIDTFEVVTLRVSTMRYVAEYEIAMKDGKAAVSYYSIRFTQSEDERVLEKRVAVDEAEALKLLNDCDVLSWDGFHGTHPRASRTAPCSTCTRSSTAGKGSTRQVRRTSRAITVT